MSKPQKKRNLHFVIVPKCAHPWADEVHEGAKVQASLLREQLGIDVVIDYRAPSFAGVAEQSSALDRAAATEPDGIAVDPVAALEDMPTIREIRDRGIPIILFHSPSPEPGMTSVGNDFAQQGIIAAERLVGLIDGRGKVAVMRGFPSAPNHRERYEAQLANVLRGDTALMTDLYDRPEWVAQLLDRCVDVEIEFARAQIEAGADIIGLGDAIASQVSPAMYRQFPLPHERRIFDAVHAQGAVARLHICGNTTRILPWMAESGADIIDLDWMVDLRARRQPRLASTGRPSAATSIPWP